MQVTVNGKTYYEHPAPSFVGEIRIVIMQNDWVLIGRFERSGSDCKLHDAATIRALGTTRGLGELAEGKPEDTVLDPCNGVVEFDYSSVVATIKVDQEKWENELGVKK